MIGIFDSGVGGLTVARAIERLNPDQSLLYYGDTARTPYGSKSRRVITDYSLENSRFLLNHGAKIIVVACNSAASAATETLRNTFDVPIIEVIRPAARQAVAHSRNGRIGVIGTRATIGSDIYRQTIIDLAPHCKVFSIACPLLVPLVEECWLDRRETKMIIKKYLRPLKDQQIDTLILACTHYPLLKDLIKHRIGRHVTLVDSSTEVAKEICSLTRTNPYLSPGDGEHQFYFSDITASAQTIADGIFGHPVRLLQP